jgi:hypothetical protein
MSDSTSDQTRRQILEILGPDADPQQVQALLALIDPPDVAMDDPPPTPGTPALTEKDRTPFILSQEIHPMKKSQMTAAMDAAIRTAEKSTTARWNALVEAQQEVMAVAGKIAADSAEGVYKAALKSMGVDTAGIHPSGLAVLYRTHAANLARGIGQHRIGMDSRSQERFDEILPDAPKVRRI